jgi:putative effector of murein hydrolase LrgA (UPF0299 family)
MLFNWIKKLETSLRRFLLIKFIPLTIHTFEQLEEKGAKNIELFLDKVVISGIILLFKLSNKVDDLNWGVSILP